MEKEKIEKEIYEQYITSLNSVIAKKSTFLIEWYWK